MQTITRNVRVIAGFGLLVLLTLGNSYLIKRQLNVQVENEGWVLHTRQVLYELQQTESLLLDAETGQRGYLLTGKPEYLEPYNQAVTEIDRHIGNLSRLTSDNPAEQANATRLGIFAHDKLNELAATIALSKQGKSAEATSIVLSGSGLQAMVNIRLVIATMQTEEAGLEAIRVASYRRSVRITNTCIAIAASVTCIGLILLARFIVRERTLRDRYTHELRSREEWFRVTLSSIGDAVIATDRDGVVTFFNPIAEELTGTSMRDAMGKEISTVFPIVNEFTGKDAQNPVEKVMKHGTVVGLANHTALRHVSGSLTPIEDSAAPIRDDQGDLIGVVLVFHDVSEMRKSQDLVRKTEKLAAAARLSATVAHEINNPLEAVVNLIFIAKNDPAAPASIVQHLSMAEQEIERVAHITRQTLGFYRESITPEAIEIGSLIESVLRMYSNKIETGGIRVQRTLQPCPPVQGVAGELKQVLSNILANAIDAAGANGSIVIRCHPADGGPYGMIEVVIADSGSGITTTHLERIFEPFFTTKKDVGTGLGLWVTKQIVERHGGTILARAASAGEGLTGAAFVLQLPCAPDA